jgi:hypothetical protein
MMCSSVEEMSSVRRDEKRSMRGEKIQDRIVIGTGTGIGIRLGTRIEVKYSRVMTAYQS